MGKLIVEGVDLTDLIGVPYVATRHPENTSARKFRKRPELGANCELFSRIVVLRSGFFIPRIRSIELWEDEIYTSDLGDPGEVIREGNIKPWDILLFLPKGADPHRVVEEVRCLKAEDCTNLSESKKFHQAVYIGHVKEYGSVHCLIHLPLETGKSVVWPLDHFAKSAKEYWVFKIKRPLVRRGGYKSGYRPNDWIFL